MAKMRNKELVIVGVDPGTTLGYAIIDLNGKIIEVKSSKEHSLNTLIENVTKRGSPVIVGTDKQKSPSFVEKFAVKIGAKVISPSKDLLVKEKRQVIKNKDIKNSHELDALASAFYAYKAIKPLLLKLNGYIDENKKENIAYELKKLVLSQKGINIKTAATLVEHPQEKDTKIIKKIIEQRRPSQSDFFKLYEEMQRLKKTNALLEQQNKTFRNNIHKMRKKYTSLSKQVNKLVSEEKIQRYMEFKEERLQNLSTLLRSKDDEINSLNAELMKLREYIASLGEYVLVKKLNNLGYTEFSQRNKIIQLRKGDILLVNDPNIFSYKTLNVIKDKIAFIITKIPANKVIKDELNCDIILSKDLPIKEEQYFAFVKKEALEKRYSMQGILNKIIDDYRKSR